MSLVNGMKVVGMVMGDKLVGMKVREMMGLCGTSC